MKPLLNWLDARTGAVSLVRRILYEQIPGGARWRHCWGTALLFTFFMQAITGFFLLTSYSASAQSAWESVYYIQSEMLAGWLVRGLHHFTSQIFIALLAIHVLQSVIFHAYTAPREFNWWLLLLLVPLGMGMSVTGWLLPFDQHGYWAARVPLNIAGIIPGIGALQQKLLLGGTEVGHLTLTRFLSLHAGFLAAATGTVLLVLCAWDRRHRPVVGANPNVAAPYWPDQALRDAIVCLAVLTTALFFVIRPRLIDPAAPLGAELGAPADPSEPFSAARPVWFVLFLFQFLKYFPGESEVWGAVVIPTLVLLMLVMMPFVGRWKFGRRFNVGFILGVAGGVTMLAWLAIAEDRGDPIYRLAVEDATRTGRRAVELAQSPAGISTLGAVALLRTDPYVQGPKIFAKHCSSCHRYGGHDGTGRIPKDPQRAPDLKGFGSREWLTEFLNPDNISSTKFFGGTKFKDGKMAKFVKKEFTGDTPAEKEQLRKVIIAVSAEAGLKSQRDADKQDARHIAEGRKLFDAEIGCSDCHRFRGGDEETSAPSLSGYASRQWLIGMISNPGHIRFYGPRNDRMPVFGDDKILEPQTIALVADWLRGEWYEPPPPTNTLTSASAPAGGK
ncbi:MAG TPA: cytochrome b N-terminal domain-containing protein [Verrucomicrobiae bacterium]|jgi:ubiquinol-cytochrome c reductase cytochrome b subunit